MRAHSGRMIWGSLLPPSLQFKATLNALQTNAVPFEVLSPYPPVLALLRTTLTTGEERRGTPPPWYSGGRHGRAARSPEDEVKC